MDTGCNTNKRPKTLKESLHSWYFWKHIVTFTVGGIVGFLYYHFVGCSSGSCAISGNPYISTVMGGLMGLFLVNSPCSRGNCS